MFPCPLLAEKLFATSKYTHSQGYALLTLSFLFCSLEKMREFGCSVIEEILCCTLLLKVFHDGIEKKPVSSRLGFTGTAKGSVAHSCLQNRLSVCLGGLHRLLVSLSPSKDTADIQAHHRSTWTEASNER